LGALRTTLALSLFLAPLLDARPRRLVVIKADGLPGTAINRWIHTSDPKTGRSVLPWMEHVFGERGTTVPNFYVRGISLSTPSWSMLDSGRHQVIRGNAEFGRLTLRVYDYLNFFPFYLNHARARRIDMPAVEVLDQAGAPMLSDLYPLADRYLKRPTPPARCVVEDGPAQLAQPRHVTLDEATL